MEASDVLFSRGQVGSIQFNQNKKEDIVLLPDPKPYTHYILIDYINSMRFILYQR